MTAALGLNPVMSTVVIIAALLLVGAAWFAWEVHRAPDAPELDPLNWCPPELASACRDHRTSRASARIDNTGGIVIAFPARLRAVNNSLDEIGTAADTVWADPVPFAPAGDPEFAPGDWTPGGAA